MIGKSRVAGCDAARILRALARTRLIETGAPIAGSLPDCRSRDAFMQAAAIRVWGAARAVAGTPAQAYLEGRGLRADSPELRFHPRTPEGAKPLTRFRPALIAAVKDESGITAVHRTFLAPDAGAVGRVPDAGWACSGGAPSGWAASGPGSA